MGGRWNKVLHVYGPLRFAFVLTFSGNCVAAIKMNALQRIVFCCDISQLCAAAVFKLHLFILNKVSQCAVFSLVAFAYASACF